MAGVLFLIGALILSTATLAAQAGSSSVVVLLIIAAITGLFWIPVKLFVYGVGPRRALATAGGASRHIPSHVKQTVMARDGGACVFCGSRESLHFDHDVPHSRGGGATIENIQILCARCNLRKGKRIV